MTFRKRLRTGSGGNKRGNRELDRRAFLVSAAATAGALATSAVPLDIFGQRGSGNGGGGKGGGNGGKTVTRNPLYIPPFVDPSGYTIEAAPGQVDFGDGLRNALVYNGLMPGPTFRADKFDNANILFNNGLTEGSTIHWHGMIVPHDMDGHPDDLVPAGGNYQYNYQILQRACMNWYHPHPHMKTGEQVCLGLAGAFIINDEEEAALNLPSGEFEIPLVIRDANFDKQGNLIYNPRSSGFFGKTALVNGTKDAAVDVKSSLYRLRILNGSNARVFRLALSNGAAMRLIGNDGGLLEFGVDVPEIEISNGERVDVIIDLGGLLPDDKVMLVDLNDGWNLLEFNVVSGPGSGGEIPAGRLSTIEPLTAPVREREFSFDGMSKINGLEYEMERIDFQVPFGETELWRFTTGGNAPHPVHIHGASYQVVSRSGGRGELFPWESGWKDTVLLQDQETVEILIRFDAFRGLYLMHCHKLEHEDMGMMMNFEVV